MQGIVGFVCDEFLDESEIGKQFKQVIGDQTSKWKGFEGEAIIAGCPVFEDGMLANNERFACLFDGFISNKNEVYDLLSYEGYHFDQNNNAQMMLYAFIEWGEECLSRIKGVFLTVIWDDEAKDLFIACDKMGQKPLYYVQQENTFAFASHFNLLMQFCGVEPVLDGGSIAELIGMYPLHSPEFGVLRGVNKLRPAHFIHWSDGELKIRRYWNLESGPHKDNLAATAQRVRFLVKDAVAKQLRGNDSVCSLLSGGVSSTANSAIAANYLAFLRGERMDTYSFDFKDVDKNLAKSTAYQNSDEQWAARVSKEFYTKHRHLVSSAQDVLNMYDGLCKRGSFLNMPVFESVFSEIFNAIGKRSSVLLSGIGADDIFWDNYVEQAEWQSVLEEREALLKPEIAFYADSKNYFDKRYEKEMDKIPRLDGECNEDEKRRAHAYFMMNWKLSHEAAIHTDLAGKRAVSLRLPLCDDSLVEYVWNIPYTMKTLGCRDKGILRLAMKGILPDDVVARKKRPCPMCYTPWLEDILRVRLELVLNDPEKPINQIVDQNVLNSKGLTLAYSPCPLPPVELYAYLLQLNNWMEQYHVKVS